jgi:hypothetical protein
MVQFLKKLPSRLPIPNFILPMKGLISLTILTLFVIPFGFPQSQLTEQLTHSTVLKTNWQVYPNPFYKTFTVSSQQKDLHIEVFTLSGQRVPSAIFREQEGDKVHYQTGLELSKGIYVVKVSTEQSYRFYKMMKV